MELMKLPAAERNAAFDALLQWDKAVLVAKDVLSQLDAKRYKAEMGVYFELYADTYGMERDPLQELLETASCRVCAIGGAFASVTRLRNRVTVGQAEVNGSVFMVKTMLDVFSEKALRAMEVVFEGSNAGQYDFEPQEVSCLVGYHHLLVGMAEERGIDAEEYLMRCIMQNVIDNGGQLKVSSNTFE